MKKDILNLNEFCEYAGIKKTKALQLLRNKEIKHYRNSRKLIYLKTEDVDAWMLQNPIDIAEKTES